MPQKSRKLNTGTGPMQRGSGRGKARPTVSAESGYRTPMMPKGTGRSVKSDLNKYGPPGAAGIAGLRRVAAQKGFFTRLNESGIPEMINRSGDAQRRLEARRQGKINAKVKAEQSGVIRTGVGRSYPMQGFAAEQEGKRWRSRSSGTFPQGEPSGKRPINFRTPGNLSDALNAGAEARRGGRPKTKGPASRTKSSGRGGGGTSTRGGSRGTGGKGAGGGAFLPGRTGFGEQ